MAEQIPHYDTVEEYQKWLLASALTESFLGKVRNVYNLHSKKEALSVVWSNDLISVIYYLARHYYMKKNKEKIRREELKETLPERPLTQKEKKEYTRLSQSFYKKKMKEERPEKYGAYLKKQLSTTTKLYYSKIELEEVIKNFKKKLSLKEYEVTNIKKKSITLKTLQQEVKNKKTTNIIIIRRK